MKLKAEEASEKSVQSGAQGARPSWLNLSGKRTKQKYAHSFLLFYISPLLYLHGGFFSLKEV